jgi:hypothetical protein
VKLRCRLAAAGLALCAGLAAAQSMDEDALRAAFVLRLAQYTQWPASALDGANFLLCASGLRASGYAALKSLDGRNVGGLPIRVRLLAQPTEAERDCHVLLLGQPDAAALKPWIASSGGAPVLVLGTSPEALRAGAGIALINEPQGMAFSVNHGESRKRGLILAAPVLKLAREVR